MADEQSARIQIGKQENGMPSILIDGEEFANKIDADGCSLEWVPDAVGGHWELRVTLISSDVIADIAADVQMRATL